MLPRHYTNALLAALVTVTVARAEESAAEAAVRKQADALVAAFDKGDAKALAGFFLADGELINEEGFVYRGTDELVALFSDFFGRFPGAKMTANVESIRTVGDKLAIEEGSRSITTKEGESRADLRYATVWVHSSSGWQVASTREVADDAPPTPHSLLESLSWLIGEWVNEGDDATVKISYRWSDDGNYILGDFEVVTDGRGEVQSTQRIGWDPAGQHIRSWLFDTDGGFTEGEWTPTDKGWMIHSAAVLPTGQKGSATVHIIPSDENRFVIKGTDRLIDGVLDEDFEVVVTKRPPAPAKDQNAQKGGSSNEGK